MLVIADDVADDPQTLLLSGRKNVLNSLAVRVRHAYISLWISAQKLTTISPMCRTQVSFWCVGRLRSDVGLKAWMSEVSAIHDTDTMRKLYNTATVFGPHSFLYANLGETPPGFCANLEHRLTVS